MIKIFFKIFLFLKKINIRETIPFWPPIFLGVLYKLNSILIFIIPITAIKSISDGKLSNTVRIILNSTFIAPPPNDDLFFFFFLIILISTFTIFFISKLRDHFIKKIKNNFYYDLKNANYKISRKRALRFKNKLIKIDNVIKTTENTIFCSILFIAIIYYQFQIGLIIISGGFIYYKIMKILRNQEKRSEKLSKKRVINYYKNRIEWLINSQSNDKKILKAILSSMVMLAIMVAIYLRTNSSISIIFIFLVRIYQNQMLNGIKDFIFRLKK